MQAIFAVTVPFFALVLAGWLAARQRILPVEAIPGLNAFVLYFALPCMLFRFGANLPVRELFDPVVLGVYLVSAAIVVALTVAVTLAPASGARHAGAVGMKDAAFGALVAAFPNSGFMGVPLLVALLGQAAAGPTISSVLADLFFTSSLCIALSQWQPHAHGGGALPAALRSLRAALANPLPWSIGLGALVSVTGLTLPGPVAKGVGMLADAASPVALFTIGAVLWRSGQPHPAHMGDTARAPRMPLARYLPVALIKLFLHPALVLGAGLAAQALGAALSAFQLMVLVLVAALPSASNVSLLAERYGADNGRIARIIMSSTVLAFVSFSAIAWLFGVQPG